MSDDKPQLSFEDALAELESLVETLERGELSLEDSLHSFAEQKVRILSADGTDAEPEPFTRDD